MRTRAVAVGVAAMLIMGLLAVPATAQSPAPPADTGAPVAVPYVDAQGVNHGTVTVKTIADPFTDFDPNSPPPEGQRYVLLTVAFEAADEEPFYADPSAVVLQDAAGYLRGPGYVPRAQPVKVPDFQSQTLAPGDRVSGAIGYVVPAGAQLAAVQYVPEYNRFIPLTSAAPGSVPPVGTPVTYTDGNGVVHGTVTVTQLADPFTDFDPNAPPPEGQRYVLLTVVFEAAEDQAMYADPYSLTLQDANGYLIGLQNVPRPPENVRPNLEAQTMSPGDRVSGYVGYVVPADLPIAAVMWSPEGGRLITLAQPGG